MSDFCGTSGTPEGPISPDAWKRAVYKRAPEPFYVQLLPPEKQGNSHSYGFRIHPVKGDNTSTITRSSRESIASLNEYDIWRRWEDCLWFQESLEVEYSRAARQKRSRLAAGKGVKKNGVYIHSDQAASWESLPFGPDPNDIARDIHQYIPKLSKKGILFRASQETIDNRFEDLRQMMRVLLQDDLPTLIQEIKATRTFTDFFGVWRRDVDLARKVQSSQKSTAERSRTSFSSSILSALPVSPASLSAKSLSPAKGKSPSRSYGHSDSSSEDGLDPPRQGRLMEKRQEFSSMRSRASSFGSQSSSSLPSTPVTMPRQLSPSSSHPVVASQDMPIRFSHNPHVPGAERSSILESLPEDCELASSPKSDLDGGLSRTRTESISRKNRNARVYGSPSFGISGAAPRSLSRYSRASLQSMRSSSTMRASAYLDELGVDYCLSSPAPEPRHQSRASVSSLASVVSNSSVDAVIPRGERSSRPANHAQRPLSVGEESCGGYDPYSEDDFDDQGDFLDAYFSDILRPHSMIPEGYPETPTVDEAMYRFSQQQNRPPLVRSHSMIPEEYPKTPTMEEAMYHIPEQQSSSTSTFSSSSAYSIRRSSLTTSISSGSTSSSGHPGHALYQGHTRGQHSHASPASLYNIRRTASKDLR
ncbi:hypothetical protein JVU11DRAFT_4501 [Chiua virens]|nr:hypothetical protein JVU11DRAFT_4501 [Chiua virens]